MHIRTALGIWLACSLVGGILIALPDSGPRLVSFSTAHGPSALDAVGIAIVLTGWLFYVGALWRRRHTLIRTASPRLVVGMTFVLGLGAGLVVASVSNDFSYWWIVGVALLVVTPIGAMRFATGS